MGAARRRILPHEISFGFFLAVTCVRLAFAAGPWNWLTLLFFTCVFGSFAIIAWSWAKPNDSVRWRARLLFYPLVLAPIFYSLKPAMAVISARRFDDLLLRADTAIFSATPSMWYQTWGTSWFNDILMLGYLFFFVHLVLVPAAYFVRDLNLFRRCIVGLFTLYGVGLLFYTLLPAGGPHRWMQFDTPLQGVVVVPLVLDWVNAGSNGVDVFPSLHFGISLYLLIFDWWHGRRRFWWCLAPCVVMWLSTVLLRFHYLVDLGGGLAVAVLGVWFARDASKFEVRGSRFELRT